MPRTRPPYPEEFRREAVELLGSSGRSVREIASDLGVTDQTLRNWRRQGEAGRRQGLTSDEKEELKQLRRRVRVLEQVLPSPDRRGSHNRLCHRDGALSRDGTHPYPDVNVWPSRRPHSSGTPSASLRRAAALREAASARVSAIAREDARQLRALVESV